MMICRETGALNDPELNCPDCGGDVCLVPVGGPVDTECHLCPPDHYRLCHSCDSPAYHRHIQVRNRYGDPLMEAVLCSDCVGRVGIHEPGKPLLRLVRPA